MTLKSAVPAILTIVSCLLWGQTRFTVGEFKGFTKSPTEHIINRHSEPVNARTFEGRVTDPTGAPITNAIVEVRGPGTNDNIKGKPTDKRGRFRVGGLGRGVYAFKITRDGFQSVVGQLVIDPDRKASVPVEIRLNIGV